MKLMRFHNWGPLSLLAVGSMIALAFNFMPINHNVKEAIYSVLGPVQQNIWIAGAGASSFFGNLAQMNSAVKENERLRLQVNDLMAKSAQLDIVKDENDLLRQGLNLELDKDFDLKLANIVAKNVAQDIIVIDQGSDDLVEEGMPVITSERVVVGRVAKVYDDYSEVLLATAKDFSFDILIGDEEIDGLVKGNGNNSASVDLVPKDKRLESGQSIFTSQLGGIFPAGLLVGTVGAVNSSDVETFKSAAVTMAFNVDGSRQVFVASGKTPLGLGKYPLNSKIK